MSDATNVSGSAQVHGAQNASILPDNFDAVTLKDFFKGLVENAQPGDRDALKGLLDDLKWLSETSSPTIKPFGSPIGGVFDKIFAMTGKQINQNLVPFLETLANNPGAFGKDLQPGMNIDQTMDAIVENAPGHLKPLMADLAEDIKGFTRANSGQSDNIAALMSYLVNKGNQIAEGNAPGTSIGGVPGESPNGVGPGNIVPDQGNTSSDIANTVTKAADALALVSKMLGNPAEMTKANLDKLAHMTRDIAAEVQKHGAGEKPAMDAKEAAAGTEPGDAGKLSKIQQYLADLLQSMIRQLQKDDGTKQSGGEKAAGGAKGGAAGGAEAAKGEAAGGAEGEGGAEDAGESGGASEAPGGGESASSGGLSVFEVIAKALGDKMTTKLKEMKALAEEISSLSSSGADSTAIAGQSAKLSAASQEFSLLSNTFSTTIKALGEGTKAAVRYT